MGHESIVQILLFILDGSPSEAVLERVKVSELISARLDGRERYLLLQGKFLQRPNDKPAPNETVGTYNPEPDP
jgi:hypothetical protein